MTPGMRIRMMRVILGLSRESFCSRHGINFNTFTSIELDRLKISKKQIQKIIQAFGKEGLYTDEPWLMDGLGQGPTRFLEKAEVSPQDILEKWVYNFFINSRKTLITTIKNDAMEPFFSEGDLVGGGWGLSAKKLLGKRCLVFLEGHFYVGTLFQCGSHFFLMPSNNKAYDSPIIFCESNAQVAEILWHIRRQSHQIPEFSILESLGERK